MALSPRFFLSSLLLLTFPPHPNLHNQANVSSKRLKRLRWINDDISMRSRAWLATANTSLPAACLSRRSITAGS